MPLGGLGLGTQHLRAITPLQNHKRMRLNKTKPSAHRKESPKRKRIKTINRKENKHQTSSNRAHLKSSVRVTERETTKRSAPKRTKRLKRSAKTDSHPCLEKESAQRRPKHQKLREWKCMPNEPPKHTNAANHPITPGAPPNPAIDSYGTASHEKARKSEERIAQKGTWIQQTVATHPLAYLLDPISKNSDAHFTIRHLNSKTRLMTRQSTQEGPAQKRARHESRDEPEEIVTLSQLTQSSEARQQQEGFRDACALKIVWGESQTENEKAANIDRFLEQILPRQSVDHPDKHVGMVLDDSLLITGLNRGSVWDDDKTCHRLKPFHTPLLQISARNWRSNLGQNSMPTKEPVRQSRTSRISKFPTRRRYLDSTRWLRVRQASNGVAHQNRCTTFSKEMKKSRTNRSPSLPIRLLRTHSKQSPNRLKSSERDTQPTRPLRSAISSKLRIKKLLQRQNNNKPWPGVSTRPYQDERLDEARLKIYRLPPPGNTKHKRLRKASQMEPSRQQPITRMQQVCRDSRRTRKPATTKSKKNPAQHTQKRQRRITEMFQKKNTPTRSHNSRAKNLTPQPRQTRPRRRNTPHNIGANLNIAQWNAQSLSQAKEMELSQFIRKHRVDILCISELGHRRKIQGLPEYSTTDLHTQGGIYWRKGLAIRDITPPCLASRSDGSRITTQIVRMQNRLILAHPYIPPDTQHNQRANYWEDLIEFLTTQGTSLPTVIMGDLNTRDYRLGRKHTEKHSYLDFLFENDIPEWHILHDPNTPTRHVNTLDNCIGNTMFIDEFKSWKAMNELPSDHRPCLVQTHLPIPNKRTRKRQETIKVVDNDATIQEFLNQVSEHDITTLSEWNKTLQQSIVHKKVKATSTKYWNGTLKKLKRQRNKVRKKLTKALQRPKNNSKKIKLLENKFRHTKNQMKYALRKAKAVFQTTKAKEASNDSTGKKGFRLCKELDPRLNKRAKTWTTHTITASKQCEDIAKKFAKVSQTEDGDGMTRKEKRRLKLILRRAKTQCSTANPPLVTRRELDTALRKANPKSARGHDGISTKLIIQLCQHEEAYNSLLKAINHTIIGCKKWPAFMKIAKIIPLPKAEPNEYRPISLLPSLAKLVESIITQRTREATQHLLAPNQFGGRSGHNPGQALQRFIHAAGMAAMNEEQFAALVFDFAKAYDKTPRHRIIAKLHKMKCPSYLILIINDWLRHRKFNVSYRNQTSTLQSAQNGIPQGSSLSVYLWLIFVNDCPLDQKQSNIFIDDTLAWRHHANKKKLLTELQKVAKQMLKWCKKNRVRLNYKKLKLILNEQEGTESIMLNGHRIEANTTITYLGATFTANKVGSRSTIQIDLKIPSQKIRQRCRIMAGLRRYRFSEKTYRTLCKAFIGGKLNYYTPWLSAETSSQNRSVWRPLEVAYNEYMRTYTGAFKTTPIPLLHAMSRFPTIRDKIKTDASLMMIKAVANDTLLGREFTNWENEGAGWSPYGAIRDTILKCSPKEYDQAIHPLVELEPRELESLYNITYHTSTKEEAIAKHKKAQLIPDDHPDRVMIYTDGSLYRTKRKGGAAAIITGPSKSVISKVSIRNCTTSFETEAIAMTIGLEGTQDKVEPKDKEIHILSDSFSCITTLESTATRPQRILAVLADVAKQTRRLSDEGNQVHMHYIPGHTGIEMNEAVDKAAKNAAKEGEKILHDPTPETYKNHILKRQNNLLNRYLAKNVKNESQFQGYPQRTYFKRPRRDKSTGETIHEYAKHSRHPLLNRARTGHCATRLHLHNIGIEDEKHCRHCLKQDIETLQHQILECEKMEDRLQNERQRYNTLETEDFNEALWTHPEEMTRILKKAKAKGCHI